MQCVLCGFALAVNLVTVSSLNSPVAGRRSGHIGTLSSQLSHVRGGYWTSDFVVKAFFKKFIYLIYFWPCWVFVAVRGLSLVVVSGGYSVTVSRLLIAVASLVAEHGL